MSTENIVTDDIPIIKSLLQQVLGSDRYKTLMRLGGMTNHTYTAQTSTGDYIVRIPGEGTEEVINRRDEEVSTRLACDLGIDAPLLFFGKTGEKVTACIPNAVTMNAHLLRDSERVVQVAEIFKKLHNCGKDTGVPFEVFDMAATYEDFIHKNRVPLYEDYEDVKRRVMALREELYADGSVKKVPCHNDSLCENWVDGNGKLYLIDWEYAGMNDAMWDLADISIEAAYDDILDERLLKAYFGREADPKEKKRFQANKVFLDYLWTLWGKIRVPFDGDEMEQYALNRYERLKQNLQKVGTI